MQNGEVKPVPAGDVLVPRGPSIEDELAQILSQAEHTNAELRYSLDELSLLLGRRLPDGAQTMTFWQRGALGRVVRRAGFDVRVELGHVIFVRSGPLTGVPGEDQN